MIIGIPKEIKDDEYRVGMTPSGVKELIKLGNEVLVQCDAGIGSGFNNGLYSDAGAKIVESMTDVYAGAELIVKVKEPQPNEVGLLKPHHTIFSYLHLASNEKLIKGLLESECTAIAYETVTINGRTPLLAPMSAIAGRLAVQEGFHHLTKAMGGKGVLPGLDNCKATVLILGAGVAGKEAAIVAKGMGAFVILLDINPDVLYWLRGSGFCAYMYDKDNLHKYLTTADLVIGTVHSPGKKAKKVITEKDVKQMEPGSVIVDVSIDQGGCCETSYPTSHRLPTYKMHDVVHYCVANMPGVVPITATRALTEVTFSYILDLCENGEGKLLEQGGINISARRVINQNILK
jgi:alanine dehydrogenase